MVTADQMISMPFRLWAAFRGSGGSASKEPSAEMPDEEPGRAVELERRYLTIRAGVGVQRLSVRRKRVKNRVHLDLVDPAPLTGAEPVALPTVAAWPTGDRRKPRAERGCALVHPPGGRPA